MCENDWSLWLEKQLLRSGVCLQEGQALAGIKVSAVGKSHLGCDEWGQLWPQRHPPGGGRGLPSAPLPGLSSLKAMSSSQFTCDVTDTCLQYIVQDDAKTP